VKPTKPEDTSHSELTATSVKISWTLGQDGGLEQTIHVQYRRENDTDWTTENVPASGGQTYLVIATLIPGTVYQYQLYASNEIGASETTPILYFVTPDGKPNTFLFYIYRS